MTSRVHRWAGGLGLLLLAGCAGGGKAATVTTPAGTTTSLTSMTTTADAGDLAACSAWASLAPEAERKIREAANGGSVFLFASTLEGQADAMEARTVAAASPDLVASLKATVAGLRSAKATVAAHTPGSGDIDVGADFKAINAASVRVSAACQDLDPFSASPVMFAG